MTSGTILCGVRDVAESRGAVDLARALGARLGLRLVLAHVVSDVPPGTHESVMGRKRQVEAAHALAAIARELGDATETRLVLGSRAETLAQVAADEGADLIVLGSRRAGFGSRNLRCSLARELEVATPVPIVVAPPSTRRREDHRLGLAAAHH